MPSSGGALFSTSSVVDARLKTAYLDYFRDQWQTGIPLASLIKRDSRYIKGGGADAKWAIRYGGNPGEGAFPNGGPFLNPGRQLSYQGTATLKNQQVAVQFEHKAIHLSKGDKFAFNSIYADEMKRAVKDRGQGFNRQCYSDGLGAIGTVSSVDDSGVITLSTTSYPRFSPITYPFKVGQQLSIYAGEDTDALAHASATNLIVNSIDESAGTVTVYKDGSAATLSTYTVAAGDIVTKMTAAAIELTGLGAIINTGAAAATFSTLFGIATATVPLWKSSVLTDNSSPTKKMFRYLHSLVKKYGGNPKFALTTWGVQDQYVTLMEEKVRYMDAPNPKAVKGEQKDQDTYTGPEVPGIGPLIADNDCPLSADAGAGTVWVIDPDALAFQQSGEPSWMDDDGSILHRIEDSTYGYPIFVGRMVHYVELICLQRNALTRATSVQEMSL